MCLLIFEAWSFDLKYLHAFYIVNNEGKSVKFGGKMKSVISKFE